MPLRSLVPSSWPAHLTLERAQNCAPALAEVPRTLASLTTFLVEHATGGPVVDEAEPSAPRNPQGLVGHDHSGPPYGAALLHPLACWAGVPDSGWTHGSRVDVDADAGGGAEPRIWSVRAWIRPHPAVADTPYSRGELAVRVQRSAGADHDVRVELWSDSARLVDEDIAVTSTSTTRVLTTLVPLPSGQWTATLRLSSRGTPGDAATVEAWALSQIEELSH